jgi:hypothetical protein
LADDEQPSQHHRGQAERAVQRRRVLDPRREVEAADGVHHRQPEAEQQAPWYQVGPVPSVVWQAKAEEEPQCSGGRRLRGDRDDRAAGHDVEPDDHSCRGEHPDPTTGEDEADDQDVLLPHLGWC